MAAGSSLVAAGFSPAVTTTPNLLFASAPQPICFRWGRRRIRWGRRRIRRKVLPEGFPQQGLSARKLSTDCTIWCLRPNGAHDDGLMFMQSTDLTITSRDRKLSATEIQARQLVRVAPATYVPVARLGRDVKPWVARRRVAEVRLLCLPHRFSQDSRFLVSGESALFALGLEIVRASCRERV